MQTIEFKVAANGRMVLPKPVRDAMGLHGEAKVTAIVDGESIRLISMKDRVKRAQEKYRRLATTPRTTDEFLADRRKEAQAENARQDTHP